MSRSRSVTKMVVRISAGIAAGGVIGWFALRYVRTQMAARAQSGSPAQEAARQSVPTTSAIADIVPAHVFTDAEPTAMEAALRDALTAEEAAATDVAPDETVWIGNTRTFVLHRADSSFLPSEEHRQYFQSEDEAISAGYRRAANE